MLPYSSVNLILNADSGISVNKDKLELSCHVDGYRK